METKILNIYVATFIFKVLYKQRLGKRVGGELWTDPKSFPFRR
jgi:hypothetical protein